MNRKVKVYSDYHNLRDGLGHEYIGVFHGFFQDHEEYESGPGHIPVALVEKADGTVESKSVACIKFVDGEA